MMSASGYSQSDKYLNIHHQDEMEIKFSQIAGLPDTTFLFGSVILETGSAMIYCDTAIYAWGSDLILRGRVVIDDVEFRMSSDEIIHYDMQTRRTEAIGEYVELWSRPDSIMAVGKHAFFDRDRDYFYMLERPTLYLNYPDSAAMIEVTSDFLEYDALNGRAEATGDVRINTEDISSVSGCAVMHPETHSLDLFDNPVVHQEESQVSGQLITITSEQGAIRQVDVIDSARGEFTQLVDSAENLYNKSKLSGKRLVMDFLLGNLDRVTCFDQAYSWYYPASKPGEPRIENSVSGDTITFLVSNNELTEVQVVGGAIGEYLTFREQMGDSSIIVTVDTIDYEAQHISYNMHDSVITLTKSASTESDDIALDAHLIKLDTKEKIVEAFSADTLTDTVTADNLFAKELQPNSIPVRLRDDNQTLYGDYLKYSIETEKGRIVTSKSSYESGYFYGNNAYRQTRDIFYLEDGRYSTCDLSEPHFHFHSKHLKLIEGDKLIAKPVVLYLGRIPLLAAPYYVFPLKKGRHSGILPFTIGNIERGERYIRNVGYYWAASEYWDWKGALDYYEERNSLNIYSSITYNKLYSFDGSISGNRARETNYSQTAGREFNKTRWTVTGRHNHTISPSFKISASGHFQSDPDYYTDFSADLKERLNRVIRSQVNFTKKFGTSVSVSGKVVHDDNLDKESRTDQLPIMSASLPTMYPFGSGTVNDEGETERRWYHQLVARYTPSMINYSSRYIEDSTYIVSIQDSIMTIIDTLTGETEDITVSDTLLDTLSYRSRKKYTRVDHSLSLSFPTTILSYLVVNPSMSYSENWFKVHESDQSLAAGIDASEFYRSYVYSFRTSLKTSLYGTVYPNVLGLAGLRQVVTPSVSYQYKPEIDREPEVSSYAGGSARSRSKSQSVGFSLNQIYQAKVRKGESEQNLDLVSITSGVSYDFEKETRKLSNLSTSFSSTLLRGVSFYGGMHHDLYKQDSDEIDVWGARLLDFSLKASFTLSGAKFLFDEPVSGLPPDSDSLSHSGSTLLAIPETGGRWSIKASLSFAESGINTSYYTKSSFVSMSMGFNLTPTTRVSYSQAYDFIKHKTINNQVNFTRTIHCWTGTFHWVPIGSNRGWGFKLFVTALPDLKISNSENLLNASYLQSVR